MNFLLPNSTFARSQLTHKHYEAGKFYNMGESTNCRGTSHILYFSSSPELSNVLRIGDENKLGGITYCYIYSMSNSIIGLMFETPAASTSCTDCLLSIVYSRMPCPLFVTQLLFEPLGLLLFKGAGGTLLLIPKEVKSSLLVEVE